MMRVLLEVATLGNPWDYLNGTEYKFGLDAGGARNVLTAIYLFMQEAGLVLGLVLIVGSICGMIYTRNAQEKAAMKKSVYQRLMTIMLISAGSGILTFIMAVLNQFFGIS